MTTILPPRSSMRRSRPRISGAVSRLHGDERVGDGDEQIIGVIHIGDGDAEEVAEHQAAGDLLGIWSTVLAV